MQGQRAPSRNKTYDINFTEPIEPEEAPSFVAAGSGNPGGDEYEGELEPEFVKAMAAQEDADALTITAFENDLEDLFQDVPELQQALVTYLEARGRLREKGRVRGFWPVTTAGKGRNGRGKAASKGFGKGKKGRDREALLQRISRSNCRICGQRGHWKAECPRNSAGTASAEAPASVAMTGHDPLDEILEAVPDGSVMMQPSGTMMGLESTGFHAGVCLYATEGEEKSIKTRG